MQATTIKQRTLTLEFDSTKVVVRRMYWKAAKDFLKLIAKHLSGLGADLANVLPRLPEIIGSVDELSTFLVVHSTDLSAEALDKLDLAQAAAVIEAAIELNCGDELKNSCAGIAAALAGLVPAAAQTTMKAGAESTPA